LERPFAFLKGEKSMSKEIEYQAINGSVSIVTEPKPIGTWLRFHVSPGSMFAVMNNTPETLRFLRTALKQMEREEGR
jgi:hypothetical protein